MNQLRDALNLIISTYEHDMLQKMQELAHVTQACADEVAENKHLTQYFIELDAENERKRIAAEKRRIHEEHVARCAMDQQMATDTLRFFFQAFKTLKLCPPDPKPEPPPGKKVTRFSKTISLGSFHLFFVIL